MYSTRRNPHDLVNLIPEPEQVYRRKLNRLTYCRILGQQEFKSVLDIQFLFKTQKVEMDDLFAPLDFSAITGYPHAFLEKGFGKSPYLSRK